MTDSKKKQLHTECRATGVLAAPSPGGMGPPPLPLPALFDSATLGVLSGTHPPGTTCLNQFDEQLGSAEDMRVFFDVDYLGQTSMDLGG
jgi:hypothetical protein